LFEILIAAAVLIIGLAGLLGLLDSTVKTSRSTRARARGTAKVRSLQNMKQNRRARA
jgi:Tfp pilus assembly protein PilV